MLFLANLLAWYWKSQIQQNYQHENQSDLN